MSAYTVSQLAHNAGVSVHIVRDYLVRGLLRPVATSSLSARSSPCAVVSTNSPSPS
ncbi:MerR family transcriptional regulator, partial [Escherichia coli]|uniref:MerR family transcriptional regulator n=1 Tax=Escherichia coli TaxID=562 RepID=UPI0013B0617E